MSLFVSQHLDLDTAASIAWETLDGDKTAEQVAARLIVDDASQPYVKYISPNQNFKGINFGPILVMIKLGRSLIGPVGE